MSTQKNTDPEAWLADQLAQVQHPNAAVPLFTPGSAVFHTVERLAQEYGEMCAARATADFEDRKEFLVAGDPVEVRIDGSPAADADRWTGEVVTEGGKLLVRPQEDE